MLVGSCALNLGRPKEALIQFTAAPTTLRAADAYQEDDFPRGAAIYLAREAEARISLDDLDGAVETAHRAVEHMGGVSSARGTSTLDGLRANSGHRCSARMATSDGTFGVDDQERSQDCHSSVPIAEGQVRKQ
ncbi:hypothetical protein AB0L26_26075 [Streptomyces nondiastaticus]|uniref:hypothetical protein n=1 Tax=Streptomyces nondiastaticus TaxID=3154512 RepID=UPI0034242877